jgi:predicted outer membrane repeat protein
MKNLTRKLARTGLAAAIAAASPFAGAATFTVTNLNDTGAGSLRDAIGQANAAAGADTITFAADLSGTIALTGGELQITDSTTIRGPGAGRVTIDAQGNGRVFHLVNANASDKAWSIGGFTVTGGAINDGNDDSGGGLYYGADSIHATIALADLVFDDNSAGRKGGAISVNGANLTLTGVFMTNNHVEGGFQPSGGALYFGRGLLQMARCRVIGNSAELDAGGIRLASPGVNAVIEDTLVQGNTATHTGGGILADTMSSFRMSRSAVVGNTTGQPYGGGIYFAGVTDAGSAENVIENSTFSGNVSLHQFGRGSALAVWQGNMTVRNSTFAYNETSPNDAPGGGAGGAVFLGSGASTKMRLDSVLFAGNPHGNAGAELDLAREIAASGTQSTLDAHFSSFQEAPAIGVISGEDTSNLRNVDPALEPLTMAGGFTPVHPLPATSPVIDRGSNPASLATDQRGAARASAATEGGATVTDIGAYEYRTDRIFFGDFDAH